MSTIDDMEAAWANATTVNTYAAGEPLPGGDHTVKLARSEIIETKKDGSPKWLLVFQDEHEREVEKWHDLRRKESADYIKTDATMLGYTGTFSGLEDWAPTVAGSECRIRVKWKSGTAGDGFPTVYLNEVIDLKTAAAPAPSNGSSPTGEKYVDESDIPF